MGNCSLKAVSGGNNGTSSIRILTDSGSILEFEAPKLAHEVLNSHPGHGIFRRGHGAAPMGRDEQLLGGRFYYLLPLASKERKMLGGAESVVATGMETEYIAAKTGKDFVESLAKGSALEVLPSGGDGVWRVKLMIDTKQLEEILSEQGNTEALIERMRMAASGSASVTPRHGKSGWKSNLSSLFNKASADHQISTRDCSASSGYWQC